MENILEVTNLSKFYGTKKVVNKLSFQIKEGEVLGILGANGAGKTTSIECILGTKKMDEGKALILGIEPKKNRKRIFEKVSVQFQNGSYQTEIKVKELCEETENLYKDTANWKELLSQFEIDDKQESLVKDLSGGERQRLFIVLALIPKSKLVFLDELTTGLDSRARRKVWKILENLKKQGLIIVLTSHFMDEVEALCDKIIILKKGNTVFQGTIKEALQISKCKKFEDAYLWFTDDNE